MPRVHREGTLDLTVTGQHPPAFKTSLHFGEFFSPHHYAIFSPRTKASIKSAAGACLRTEVGLSLFSSWCLVLYCRHASSSSRYLEQGNTGDNRGDKNGDQVNGRRERMSAGSRTICRREEGMQGDEEGEADGAVPSPREAGAAISCAEEEHNSVLR